MSKKHSFFLAAGIFLLVTGCASMRAPGLLTAPMEDKKIEGRSFSLILYGRTHGEDLESVALIDPEDDAYEIVPYAREYRFVIARNMSAEKALQEAERFAGAHPSFMGVRLSRITDRQGKVFGYEVRPLYQFLRFGTDDVLDTSYVLHGTKVDAYISVNPVFEDLFERDRSASDD